MKTTPRVTLTTEKTLASLKKPWTRHYLHQHQRIFFLFFYPMMKYIWKEVTWAGSNCLRSEHMLLVLELFGEVGWLLPGWGNWPGPVTPGNKRCFLTTTLSLSLSVYSITFSLSFPFHHFPSHSLCHLPSLGLIFLTFSDASREAESVKTKAEKEPHTRIYTQDSLQGLSSFLLRPGGCSVKVSVSFCL